MMSNESARRLMPRSGWRRRSVSGPASPGHTSGLLRGFYPTVLAGTEAYVQPSVRIEAGAKSALDPNVAAAVEPYVAEELTADLRVPAVTTIEARRTFWDKVVILHGLRRWFESKGELRQEGQRVSRHYYDIHCLFAANAGREAVDDLDLGTECVRHARLFFDRPAFDLASAAPGTFAVAPVGEMLPRLKRDYDRMSGMIFGAIPAFDEVIESVAQLEHQLNGRG